MTETIPSPTRTSLQFVGLFLNLVTADLHLALLIFLPSHKNREKQLRVNCGPMRIVSFFGPGHWTWRKMLRIQGSLEVSSTRKVKEKASCLEEEGLTANEMKTFTCLIKNLQCWRVKLRHGGSRAQNQDEWVTWRGPRRRCEQLSQSSQALAISGDQELLAGKKKPKKTLFAGGAQAGGI